MTSLEASTYTVETGESMQRVIEDGPLLRWAEAAGLSPHAAQVTALEQNVMPLRYLKNRNGIQMREQLRLCRSRVLICGCGGLGGVLGSLLARVGVGFLRLVDGDAFAPSNLNRQWFCDMDSLGRNKAETARDRIQRINPLIQVEAVPRHFDDANGAELTRSIDLVVDALDNLPARFTLFEWARKAGLPFLHGAVAGWWGQVASFMPGSPCHLRQVYGDRRQRTAEEEALGVLGPAAALIGSLQSLEAVRVLTGRPPAYSDRLLYYDGESGDQMILTLQATSTPE